MWKLRPRTGRGLAKVIQHGVVGLELGPGALIPSPVLALRVLGIVSESMLRFSRFHHC